MMGLFHMQIAGGIAHGHKWVTVQTRGLTDDTMGGDLYKKFSLICLPLFFSHEVFSKVCISLDY